MSKLFNYKNCIATALFLTHPLMLSHVVMAESDPTLQDLPSLDMDDLLAADVQVTSAMKRLQNMSETAASIYVLSNKEIVESGATSVAQALTLVPGMQVRKLDNNQWAITSRSVAGRHTSRLLVMVDGQSIYNPAFAGAYWEALNMPLYDIERIEVIRGQGGLLWGSNATNGVVNIISKHTADTRNVLVQGATGTQTEHKVDVRVGGDLANYSSFRLFASIEETDKSDVSNFDIEPNDSGQKKTLGGRVDLSVNDDLSILAQAQYTHIEMGQNLRLADLSNFQPIYVEDKYTRDHFQLMTRAEHRLSASSNQMLQASVSSQQGDELYYKSEFLTTDIDYQMNTLLDGIQLDWGLNYRYTDINSYDTDYFTQIQNINSYHHFGGFIQAQFNLVPDRLKLIVGNRSEKNSFTGWEHQPMARLLWTPNDQHTLWTAVSQGVRIPSLVEYNGVGLGASGTGLKIQFIGNEDMQAEKSISNELGYRYTADSWGVDMSVFYTKAKNVAAIEQNIVFTQTPFGALPTGANADFTSDAKLQTYGGEAVIKWQPYDKLSTEIGYSFTAYEYDLPTGIEPIVGYDSYLRQVLLKTHLSLTTNHSISAIYRIEDGEAYDTDNFSVLDLTWNWQITPSVKLSLTGNNLLYGKHLEYNNTNETYTVSTYIEPSYLAQITANF